MPIVVLNMGGVVLSKGGVVLSKGGVILLPESFGVVDLASNGGIRKSVFVVEYSVEGVVDFASKGGIGKSVFAVEKSALVGRGGVRKSSINK